jgi:hypothetical protein
MKKNPIFSTSPSTLLLGVALTLTPVAVYAATGSRVLRSSSRYTVEMSKDHGNNGELRQIVAISKFDGLLASRGLTDTEGAPANMATMGGKAVLADGQALTLKIDQRN